MLSVALAGFYGCNNSNNSTPKGHMQVKLHDAPALYGSLQLDIQKVEVKNSATSSDNAWVTISDKPMTINVLDLTNGNAKIIASSNLKAGTYTKLRLVLGSNNKINFNGTMMDLKLSSSAQNGVDVDINTKIDGQNSATLLLDFDAARSISSTLTGSLTLNPQISANQQSKSGDISGTIKPASALTVVYVKSGSDTVSSTFADTTSGAFKVMGISQGNYDLNFHTMDSAYSDTTVSGVSVNAKQETKLGVIALPSGM